MTNENWPTDKDEKSVVIYGSHAYGWDGLSDLVAPTAAELAAMVGRVAAADVAGVWREETRRVFVVRKPSLLDPRGMAIILR